MGLLTRSSGLLTLPLLVVALGAEVRSGPYRPGQTYYGSSRYIEYLAGDSSVILSAAHDGDIGGATTTTPFASRQQQNCDFSQDEDGFNILADAGTQSLTRKMAVEFRARTGRWPHVVINRLHRAKLDANRTMDGGACGIPQAEEAWRDYHDFINAAKATAMSQFGKAWYVDVHGHNHSPRRIELGYRVSKTDLNHAGGDAHLNTGAIEFNSTIRRIAEESHLPFAALLRGAPSLGNLFDTALYRSIPSTRYPGPGTASFFPGAYNVKAHTCVGSNPPTEVCGLQMELYNAAPAAGLPGIRDSNDNQQDFAEAIVGVFETYLGLNAGVSMTSRAGEIIVDNDDALNDPDRADVRVLSTSDWRTAPSHGTILHDQLVSTVPSGGASRTGVEYLWRVPSPGTYSVYVWWTSDASRTTGARYRVFTRDTTAAADRVFDGARNQRINGGRWNLLGSWRFPHAGAMAKVSIERTGSAGTISADAIRVVRHDGTGVLPPQPPRPRGWYSRDIGSVGNGGAGDAVEGNGTWTVDGAGADVWGTSDAFHYTYRWLQGNGSITARVASLTGTADWTKVGVMMRGSPAANAAHAFLLVAKAVKGVAFQYRLSTGGGTANTPAGSGTAPRWVRLTRSGNSITAAVSADGVAWTNVGTRTYTTGAMPANILVGLAVSSHVTGRTAKGVFDNLSVIP